MKDFKNDPNYLIQYDQDIKNLPIDNILLENEEETTRIKEHLWNAIDNDRKKVGVTFDWYDIYQFLENGGKLSIKTCEAK